MPREAVNLPELAERTYSHAIVEDGHVFLSGQVPRNAEGEIVGETLEEQTLATFDNIRRLLKAVDRDLSDVAKVTGYIVGDPEDLDGYSRVFEDLFDEPYPCQTVVGTVPLGDPDLLIEIEVELPPA